LLYRSQDDDDTHEFSKTLAFDYINQAEATFVEIEEALCVLIPRFQACSFRLSARSLLRCHTNR
jgi:hypothetical protein